MPKRSDIKSVLIIGAGPIVIGQACEFDYSGAQACKALMEEGIRVILINSTPATIMTDPIMADATTSAGATTIEYYDQTNYSIAYAANDDDEDTGTSQVARQLKATRRTGGADEPLLS